MKRIPPGIFTAKEATEYQLSRGNLAQMVARGELVRLSRGIYAASKAHERTMPEITMLAKRGTNFVVALESALYIHELTSANPHRLWIAIKRGSRAPKIDIPLQIVRVDERTFDNGAEWHEIDDIKVRVYSAARTIADLFKFRNKVGMELAVSALKEGLKKRLFTVDELFKYAKLDRVDKIIMPYVEGYFG